MSVAIKVHLIGDFGVGKTHLLAAYTTKSFPPTSLTHGLNQFDIYTEDHEVEGKLYTLEICDTLRTPGDDHDPLRVLSYLETDIFLLCFSLTNLVSYENLRTKWYPEVVHYRPDAAVFLVGVQKDLRGRYTMPDSKGSDLGRNTVKVPGWGEERSDITPDQGFALREEVGAFMYAECSSFTGEGVRALFQEVLAVGLRIKAKHRRSKPQCTIA